MEKRFITNIGELKACKIIERINRFTVKVAFENNIEKALLTNTGRLKDIIFEGNEALCLEIEKPKKLRYVLVGTKANGEYTLIDTRLQMKCFEIAVEKGMVDWLKGASLHKRNIRVRNSFLDYLFKKGDEEIFIEVKSAVLFNSYFAMYPDCPSLRGRRHVEELIELTSRGKRAMLVFIAAHPLAKAFKPNEEGDEILSKEIKEAREKGVELHAIQMTLKENGDVFLINSDLPIHL